jgi:hypothetical protein
VKGAPVTSSQSLVGSGMVGLSTEIRGCGARAREVASEDWLHERAEDDLGPTGKELVASSSTEDRLLTQIGEEQATG